MHVFCIGLYLHVGMHKDCGCRPAATSLAGQQDEVELSGLPWQLPLCPGSMNESSCQACLTLSAT